MAWLSCLGCGSQHQGVYLGGYIKAKASSNVYVSLGCSSCKAHELRSMGVCTADMLSDTIFWVLLLKAFSSRSDFIFMNNLMV